MCQRKKKIEKVEKSNFVAHMLGGGWIKGVLPGERLAAQTQTRSLSLGWRT